MLGRGASGATTISPPRAAETVAAAPPTTGEKGVRVGARARARPSRAPLTRRAAARRRSPSSRAPMR
eukprot:15466947-Alexandrium_andersonii.AAC.1